MSKLLDSSDSDDDVNIKINNNNAERYNTSRQKEETQKLKDRHGERAARGFNGLNNEDSSTSSSSEDDEFAEEPTKDFYKNFYKTLACLKKKDPRIYDPTIKFFSEEPSSKEENNTNKKSNKKEKPLFLRDFERELIINKNGEFVDEEETKEKKPTIVEKNKALIDSFKARDDSDEELLFTTKKTTINEEKDEDEVDDYVELLKGQKDDLKDKEALKDLKPLKEFWTNPDLDPKESFLRDYLLNNNRFLEENEVNEIHLVDQEEEEENKFRAQQEEYEHKYNFRFEDPDPEFIKRYPRIMENSLRKKDTKRKEQREQYKKRKEEEKAKKRQELNKFKSMKQKEILEKIEKLKEIAGNTDVAFQEDDIEGDFDPDAYDKRMKELFNQDFYQGPVDEDKPEFKDNDEDLEIENWDDWKVDNEVDDYNQYNEDENTAMEPTVPLCEDPNFIMDCDYDPNSKKVEDELIENTKGKKKKRKKKSKFAEVLLKEKPKDFPESDNKSLEKYMDEYYKYDYEDIIGDVKCRFKYRSVIPNDFGLTTDEILKAPERELNRWCSLKKAVQYRDKKSEIYDLHAYKQRAQNMNLKKKILPSLYKTPSDKEQDQTTETLPAKKKRNRSKSKHKLIKEEINIKSEENSDSNENPSKKLKLDIQDKETVNEVKKESGEEETKKLEIKSERSDSNETDINRLEKLKDQKTETLPAKKKRSRSKKKHFLIKEEINIKSEQNSDSIETNSNPSEKLKLEVQDKETDSQVNEVKIESGEGETKKLEIKSNTSTKKKKKKKIAGIPSEENNKMKKNQTKKLKFNSKKKLFGKLDPIRSNSYKILRGISNRICEVDNGCRRPDSKLYHISKLLPYDMEPD